MNDHIPSPAVCIHGIRAPHECRDCIHEEDRARLPDAERGPRIMFMHQVTFANGHEIGGYKGEVVPLEDYNKMREQCKRQRRALEAARLQHLVCDDSWYSCPLSKEGCANEYDSGCTCGAEKHNAAIDAALGLPSSARQEQK